MWDAVGGGPPRDTTKFRDELLWQEYARHWYARLGAATRTGVRRELPTAASGPVDPQGMACLDLVHEELHTDGWLVNQARMWLASHWAIRNGKTWRDGEDEMFRHLLDGSRAANRLGWQWTTGVGSHKPYGFSRWQVAKRAPQLCDTCAHADSCPIENWPDDPHYVTAPNRTDSVGADWVGPEYVITNETPDSVWLTAESLGHDDPALSTNPALPAIFVFDEPLLTQLQLSAKRLVFLVEALAELAEERQLEVILGDPVKALAGRRLAVTHAPVPGFARRSEYLRPVETHPWPWLCGPTNGSVASFSAWRKSVRPPG